MLIVRFPVYPHCSSLNRIWLNCFRTPKISNRFNGDLWIINHNFWNLLLYLQEDQKKKLELGFSLFRLTIFQIYLGIVRLYILFSPTKKPNCIRMRIIPLAIQTVHASNNGDLWRMRDFLPILLGIPKWCKGREKVYFSSLFLFLNVFSLFSCQIFFADQMHTWKGPKVVAVCRTLGVKVYSSSSESYFVFLVQILTYYHPVYFVK